MRQNYYSMYVNIPDQSVNEDQRFDFTLLETTFNEVNIDDSLSYTACLEDENALPSWISFNPVSMHFSGIPSNDDVGVISIKVTATDLFSASVSDSFFLTVVNINDAPIIANKIPDQAVNEDSLLDISIQTDTFIDVDAEDALVYTATLDNDTALPAWLTFDAEALKFNGMPTNDHIGTLRIKVIAKDMSNAVVSDTFSLTVVNINDAPTLTKSIMDQSINEDEWFTCTIDATTFHDVDAGDILTYTATLDDDNMLPPWLTFNPDTLMFSGTPTNEYVGTMTVKVTAMDQAETFISDAFLLTVFNINDAPYVANEIPNQSVVKANVFDYTLNSNTFIDVDANDSLTFTATLENGHALPAWLRFNPATTNFNGTPTYEDIGSMVITVTATDESMISVSDAFILTVVFSNDEPTLVNTIPDQTVNEDDEWQYIVPSDTFNDVNIGDSLAYTARLDNHSKLPEWLHFNPKTRLFSGVPTNDDVGTLSIQVTATDNFAASVSDTFNLTVFNTNDAPILANPIQNYTVYEDQEFQITLNENTFVDVDQGDRLTYTATLQDGSIVNIFDPTTQTFKATLGNSYVGTFTIKVTATDQSLEQASGTFVIKVLNVNDPPIIVDTIPDQTAKENDQFNLTFSDHLFTDFDPGDALSYSSCLENNSPLPSWLTFDPENRSYSGIPAKADIGTIQIKVIATDQSYSSTYQVFELTVDSENNPPILVKEIPDQQAKEDSLFSFTIDPESFQDNDVNDMLIFTAQQEDGTSLPKWIRLDVILGKFTGRPSNSDIGVIHVKLTATDTFFNSVSDVFTLTVINTNDSPKVIQTVAMQTAFENQPFTFTFDDTIFYDEDSDDKLSYTITMGNNRDLPSWLHFNSMTRTFTGTPLSGDAGNLIIKLIAYDMAMASASTSFIIAVNKLNYTPTLANSIPNQTAFVNTEFSFTIQEDTFTDLNDNTVLTYTAMQTDGNELPSWLSFQTDTRTFTGTPQNHDIGNIQIKVIVYDPLLASTSDTFTLDILEDISQRRRSISGLVMGSPTHELLQGYYVEVWKKNVGFLNDAITDQAGFYKVEDLPQSDDLILAVYPPLGISTYQKQIFLDEENMGAADLLSTQYMDLTQVNLLLKQSSQFGISGRVHDGVDGLSNMQVDVFSMQSLHSMSAITDDAGYYTLTGLKENEAYQVSVWSDEYNAQFYYGIPENETPGIYIPLTSIKTQNDSTQINPTLPPLANIDLIINQSNDEGIIAGHVYLEDNTPIGGLVVQAWSNYFNQGNFSVTDESGAYTIDGLNRVMSSDAKEKGYIVSVDGHLSSGMSYPYQAYNNVSDNLNATIIETNRNDIDFYLLKGHSITGTVMDIDNQPIQGVYITAWSKQLKQHAETTTDATGAYTFLCMPIAKDYMITAYYPNYPLMVYDHQTNENLADVVNNILAPVADIDFTLNKGYVIRGVVYIETTEQTAPEGIWVNIWSETTQKSQEILTDINGMYEFTGLNPNIEDYVISIRKDGYMPAWYDDNQDSNLFNDTSYTLERFSGVAPELTDVAHIRHIVLKTGLRIGGLVLFEGLLKPGITLNAISEQSGGFGSTESMDHIENGTNYNYIIHGLSPGLYDVSIVSDEYENQTIPVTLTNEDITTVQFDLIEQQYQITGEITGLANGTVIHINATSPSLKFSRSIQMTGNGNPRYKYVIDGLKPADDYIVELYHPNQYLVYNKKLKSSSGDRVIVNGLVTGIDFAIIEGFHTISGNVTFPMSAVNGEKAYIDVYSDKTGCYGRTVAIFSQELETFSVPYTITGLRQGDDYIVMIYADRYQTEFYDQQTQSDKAEYVNTADDIDDQAIDFVLHSEASICGTVFDNTNQGASGMIVVAYSNKTNTLRGAITLEDGTYCIEGLDFSEDYEVKVSRESDTAPFYYNETMTTRDRSQAAAVSTIEIKHQKGIDFYIAQLEKISGKIRDISGRPLANIWVSAWSESQQAGFGVSTLSDGTYIIDDLPKSLDYKLSIHPDASLLYIPQERAQIASNSENIDFVLYKGWSLTGSVTDPKGNALSNAQVEIQSDVRNIIKWAATNESGQFTIKGLATATDYIMQVNAPPHASYVSYNEININISNDQSRTIVLNYGYSIKGHIYESDGITPIASIIISAFSKSLNINGTAVSDSEGFYQLRNLPQGFDYELTFSSPYYAKEQKLDILSGSTVDMVLQKGSMITGFVKTDSGAAITDVRVEVISQTMQLLAVGLTEQNGYYAVDGLKPLDRNNNPVTDYIIKIFAQGYVSQTSGPHRAGETVNFVCIKGSENELRGIIEDSNGEPFELQSGEQVILKVYREVTAGGFIKKVEVNSDASFKIEGLSPNESYQLKVIYLINNDIIKNQWSGNNHEGVTSRSEAKIYHTTEGETIHFKFSN